MSKYLLLLLLIFATHTVGVAQNGYNPLTGNNTNILIDDIRSDYGPRRVSGAATKFHRGIDLRRVRDAIGYTIEGGDLLHIGAFGTQQTVSYAYIDVGNWRYMHMRQTNGQETNSNGAVFNAPTNWEIISDGVDGDNDDLLILRTTVNGVQTINVYSANPNGMYRDGLYTINSVSYTIQRYIPAGSPVFMAGRFDIAGSGPHLHLQSTDGGTNPLTIVPRPDANTANIRLSNSFKLVNGNTLTAFSNANVIYGNVMLESRYNSHTDKDFGELGILMRPNGTNDFVPFFNWRYSGNNRIDTHASSGLSQTPANNVRLTPRGATTLITVQQAIDDEREGIYPLSGDSLSSELLKKLWNTQTLKSTDPYDPIYSDNNYEIRMVARDLTNHETINTHTKTVDNYLPFIKKVEVFKLNGAKEEIIYSREWKWNGSGLVLGDAVTAPCQDNVDVKIRIISSEPLASVSLMLGNQNIGTKLLPESVDNEHQVWLFSIAHTSTISGNNIIRISGLDLAGNALQTNPNILSRRNVDGSRPLTVITGVDERHVFSLVSSVNILPDFTAIHVDPFNSKRLQFIDLSTPADKIKVWEWRNASEVFSNEQSPIFVFNDFGAKSVRLTVKEEIGSAGFTKERTVLVESMVKPIPDFEVELRPQGTGLSVLLHDATKGIVGTWKWIITKKGTLKSTSIDEFIYTGKNPQDILLEQGTYYDVTLEASNEAGVVSRTKPQCIFYEEGITPEVSILTTKESALDFTFLINAMQFKGFVNYEVDFGDGTSISYPNESCMLNVSHQYPFGGIYTIKVIASGTDLYTGTNCTATASYQVSPNYADLQLTMSSNPSSNFLTWDAIAFSGANTNRCEESRIYYWWTVFKGAEINQNSTPIKAVYGISKIGEPISNFNYTFLEPGTYVVNLNVWNDRQLSGNTQRIVTVGESPIPIKVKLEVPEKYKNGICANTTVVFGGSVFNDYAQTSDTYPTTMRWTLYRNGTIVAGYPVVQLAGEGGVMDGYSMNRSRVLDVGEPGKYILRLEGWCNKKMKDADAKPENNNSLGYYDVKEVDIIVSSNLSALQVSNWPENRTCLENTFNFNVSNPGKKTMIYQVEGDIKSNSWLTVVAGSSGIDKGVVSVKCSANLSPSPRYGIVNVFADGAQDSPRELHITQAGAAGEAEQLIADLTGSEGDRFGHSVAICGEYAVIGAPYDDDNGKNDCGSFCLARKVNGVWSILSKCYGNDTNGNLGFSIDMTSDYIIVGEPGMCRAKVVLYNSSGVNWGVLDEFYTICRLSNTNYKRFGSNVAISGDNCIVGSEQSEINGTKSGTICFYTRTLESMFNNMPVKNRWCLVKTIHGSKGNDVFGSAIDIDGDFAVIGASGGRYVNIYQRNLGGGNNWGLDGSIKEEFEGFGRAVAISANIVNISYYFYKPNVYKGKVSEYQRGINSLWTQTDNYDRSIYYSHNNEFGCAIASTKSQLAIGAKTEKTDFGISGLTWQKRHGPINALSSPRVYWDWGKGKAVSRVYPLSVNDNFGYDVGIDMFNQIVGAPGEGNNKGMVYVENYDVNPGLCGTFLLLENFTKYSGIYSDVKAVSITLGGGGYDATFRSGAKITYIGESIVLKPGVHIQSGAMVELKSDIICSKIPKSPELEDEIPVDTYEYMNDSESDMIDEYGLINLNLVDIAERVFKFRFTEKEGVLTDILVLNEKDEQVFSVLQSGGVEFCIDLTPYPNGQYTIRVLRGGKIFERLLMIY